MSIAELRPACQERGLINSGLKKVFPRLFWGYEIERLLHSIEWMAGPLRQQEGSYHPAAALQRPCDHFSSTPSYW